MVLGLIIITLGGWGCMEDYMDQDYMVQGYMVQGYMDQVYTVSAVFPGDYMDH